MGTSCGDGGRKVTHGNVGMKNQLQGQSDADPDMEMEKDGNQPWEWRDADLAGGWRDADPAVGVEGWIQAQPHGQRGTRGSPEQGKGGWLQVGADSALPQLLEMKSTDRKQTLLHYLVRVIMEKYPELTGFHTELHFLDKAGTGSAHGPWAGG